MPANPFLIAGGILSALASLLHIAVIAGGPAWYRFFGAGEGMARMAERGSPVPTLITLGIAAAWTGSMAGWLTGAAGLKYFDFVATFVFLMLAGRWLQQLAVERNSRRMLQGAMVPPSLSVCLPDGTEKLKPLEDLAPGECLRLRPGELCPVRSRLISPQAGISLEWINGESEAAARSAGQLVPSGALVVSHRPVDVEALERWEGSLLQRLASSDRPEHAFSPYVSALLRYYLLAVLVLGTGGGLWWLISGAGMAAAMQVMISVFVVSCPCALGVAAPYADDLAASRLQRLGVFVRSSFLWQRLVRVRHVLFDKTGTLTAENPRLLNPSALDALHRDDLPALHRLAGASLHPVCRSLFDALGSRDALPEAGAGGVEEEVGMGLTLHTTSGVLYALGRPGWKDRDASTVPQGDVVFSRDGVVLGSFMFEDQLRPSTRVAVDELRARGLEISMLSGDRCEKVARVAAQLGLDESHWHGEMTPDQKAAQVRQAGSGHTLFIGDGANDSLAFDASLCAGSPVTGKNFLEHKADFYFLGNSLRFLPALLEVAHRRMRAVRLVFGFALLYNAGAILMALAGFMSPLLAAVLMPASSVVTLGLVQAVLGRGQRGLAAQKRAARPQAVRGGRSEAVAA